MSDLHPAQIALRKIRAIANNPGTTDTHGNQYATGMRRAANILEEAICKPGKPLVDKSRVRELIHEVEDHTSANKPDGRSRSIREFMFWRDLKVVLEKAYETY